MRAGEAIANMLRRLPNLRMLSVNGASADGITESFSLGAALRPLLEVRFAVLRLRQNIKLQD